MLSAPAGKHPRSSADWSGPKTFVSILDSSSLEDATNNFCFEEDPQDPCPAQPVSKVRRDMELVVYYVIVCPAFVLDVVGERRKEWRRQPMRRRRRGRRGAGQEVAGGGGGACGDGSISD